MAGSAAGGIVVVLGGPDATSGETVYGQPDTTLKPEPSGDTLPVTGVEVVVIFLVALAFFGLSLIGIKYGRSK